MFNSDKKLTIKKILKRIGKFKPLILLSIILAVLTVGFTLYINILIGQAIDFIIGKDNVDFDNLYSLLIITAICTLIVGISQWCMHIINNKITFSVVKSLRDDVFKHIQKLPVKYIDSNTTGSIISRIITDIDKFSDGLILGFTQLLTGAMTIIGTLAFMLYINWIIALVVVLITPLSFVVASFIAKKTHYLFTMQSQIRAEQTSVIEESIGELKTVKVFNQEDEILDAYSEVNDRLKRCSVKAIFYSSITNPATRFVNSIVYAGVGVSGAIAAISGSLSVGSLTIFLSYANQYTKPFNEISGVVTELQNALACAARVFELLEEEPIIENTNEKLLKSEVKGNIEISDVAFSYSKEKELIKNFNLSVKSGEKVAIVGPTGCGKTTLINLLMRFYNADKGQILVDNIDTQKMSRQELRSYFGIVLQDTWLKSGTIKDNISLSKPNATKDEIISAAKSANAHSFIKRLPHGYNTMIDETGELLSAGQKQLLCIARLMLSLPPMLILDEATSSIDTRTEQKIQKAFDVMMKGRTTFIVAHRLSTIEKADTILVMKDGKIIEHGKHSELLGKNGFYKELYESQFVG